MNPRSSLLAGLRAAALTALALLGLCGMRSAAADPWEAAMPDGRVATLTVDPALRSQGYALRARYADGTPDAAFGHNGHALVRLGPDNDGPAALRSDALGRLWVAGASHDGVRWTAVLLRFTPQGEADDGFGTDGRLVSVPAGLQARARDVLPQPDGSAWVIGVVMTAAGVERPGWWRLNARGEVDPDFGLGGLWQGPDGGELTALAAGPQGRIAVAMAVADGPGVAYEIWTLDPAPGSQPQRVARTDRLAAAPAQAPALRWQSDAWQLGALPVHSTAGAAVSGAQAVPAASGSAALPMPESASPSASSPAVGDDPSDGGGVIAWILALVVAALLAYLVARRRGHS